MKAGIITFHYALNYGAVLQSFALQEALTKLGINAEIINYHTKSLDDEYNIFHMNFSSIKKVCYSILIFPSRIVKYYKFGRFIHQNLKLTGIYNSDTISECNGLFDVYIVGSDQVWNYNITNFDKTYFLDFCAEKEMKYSYSASLGMNSVDRAKLIEISQLLSDFQCVSVREESARKVLETIYSENITVSLDPVFLLKMDEWSKFANNSQVKRPYILTYKLNNSDTYTNAKLLMEKCNYPVIAIQAQFRNIPTHFRKRRSDSPGEFLQWIRDAEYVVTDSFHGVAFSIIFHKKFIVYLDREISNKNARIIDLLKLLGLSSRIGEIDMINDEIDYKNVDEILYIELQKSIDYLSCIGKHNEK